MVCRPSFLTEAQLIIINRHINHSPRFLFWIEGTRVKRSDLGGGSIISIVDSDMLHPYLLAVRHATKDIFWADHGKVESATFDGNNRRQVWNSPTVLHYAAMDIYKVSFQLTSNSFKEMARNVSHTS